jgi:hypothetical protein
MLLKNNFTKIIVITTFLNPLGHLNSLPIYNLIGTHSILAGYRSLRTITNFTQLIELVFGSSLFTLTHKSNYAFFNYILFNLEQPKLINSFNNNISKNLNLSDLNLNKLPYLYFSCLEEFDVVTTGIILNNKVIKDYDFKSGDLTSYVEYDKFLLKNLDEHYRKILLGDYEDLYRPNMYEYEDQIPHINNFKFENHVYINYWSHFLDISY